MCWLKVGKVETFERCMNPREREKDIIREREWEMNFSRDWKKTLKTVEGKQMLIECYRSEWKREINHSCFIFQIRPVIDKQFSFMEADKAYKKMEEGHTRGKIVLNMAQWSWGKRLCRCTRKKRHCSERVNRETPCFVSYNVNKWIVIGTVCEQLITERLSHDIVFIFPRMKQDLLKKWKIVLVHFSIHIYALICVMFGDRGSD